jgi:hypothetical protein
VLRGKGSGPRKMHDYKGGHNYSGPQLETPLSENRDAVRARLDVSPC